MDLSDLPFVGKFIAAGGALLDIAFHGGDFLVAIVFGIIGQPEILASILITLDRLADRIDLIPSGIVSDLLSIVLVMVLVVYLGRLFEGATENS